MATLSPESHSTEKEAAPQHVDVENQRNGNGSGDESDERDLAEWGYKQELKRDWGLMHNFGISFSIIVGLPNATELQRRKLTFDSQLSLVSPHSSAMD